jgi:hypothetical protein
VSTVLFNAKISPRIQLDTSMPTQREWTASVRVDGKALEESDINLSNDDRKISCRIPCLPGAVSGSPQHCFQVDTDSCCSNLTSNLKEDVKMKLLFPIKSMMCRSEKFVLSRDCF